MKLVQRQSGVDYSISQYERVEKLISKRLPRIILAIGCFLASMLYFYAFYSDYLHRNISLVAVVIRWCLISILVGVSFYLVVSVFLSVWKQYYGRRLPESYFQEKLSKERAATQIDMLERKAYILSRRLKNKTMFVFLALIPSMLATVILGTTALLSNIELSNLNIGIFVGVII